MLLNYLTFMFGTGLGAVVRFKLTNQMKKTNKGQLATLIVNLSGSFIAGILFNFPTSMYLIILIFGFIGGMTTYSTFNGELANSFFGLKIKNALVYLIISYGLGLFLCYVGYLIPQFV